MRRLLELATTVSLILAASGCQTMKGTQDKEITADAETELSVARAFLESGRPDKAMYELKTLLEKDPKNVGAHTMMGLSQMALKNPTKAVEHLKIAWSLEPVAQNALNLSSAYLQAKQLKNAQEIITKGLSSKEKPPYKYKERFYHNLALIAQIKGKTGVAEKAFRKALEENPTFYMSRQQLALLLNKSGKIEAAKEQWELARIACPLCFEPTENLARYYYGKGDLRTAIGLISDFKKLEGINPPDAKRALELETQLHVTRSKLAKEAATQTKTR
jgi:Tfp pilus assembly protein PilF